jgi:hypothetical protein
MESYPRQAGALVTVVAVEEAHVVVVDADSVHHRARCISSRASREMEPLKPGDVLYDFWLSFVHRFVLIDGRADGPP